jgi:uncharacterized protein (TIGR00251 family)
MNLPVRAFRDGARFAVRVTPRASRTALAGVMGMGDEAVIKVSLNSPPVDGKANAALIEYLAEVLGIPRSAVEIAGGPQSRNKIIQVRGQSAAEVTARLEVALGRIRV